MENNEYPIGTSNEYIKKVQGLYNYSIGNRDKVLFLNPTERRYSSNPEAYSGVNAPGIGEPFFLSDSKVENNEFLDKMGGLVGYTFQGGYLTRGNYKVISNFEDVEKHQREIYYNTLKPFNRIQKPYYEKHDFKDNIKFLYYTDLKYSPITFDLSFLDRLYDYYTKQREISLYGNSSSFGEFNPVRHTVNKYNPSEGNTYVDDKVNPETKYSINKESVYKSGDSIDRNLNQDYTGGKTWKNEGKEGLNGLYEGESVGIYDELSPGHDKLEIGGNAGVFEIVKDDFKGSKLLSKTNELFKEGKINSLINRFHTKTIEGGKELTQSAIDNKFGLSRGRNLLKSNQSNELFLGKYDNPYCRVWTVANQYGKLNTAIRPLISVDDSDNTTVTSFDDKLDVGLRPFSEHGIRKNSAFQTNGLPMVAPVGNDRNENIKKCMFSIENLAWRDINFSQDVVRNNRNLGKVLSDEQKGPNGGRIMWFPPYNLKFSENVGVNWNENSFIGRGEKIYTYTNTERSGQLEFTLLIDHPSVLNVFSRKNGDGNKKETDEKILKFFAGCGNLEGSSVQSTPSDSVSKSEDIENNESTDTKPNETVYSIKKKMYVFFPNNFTGIDNLPNSDISFNYLLNGGSQHQGYEGGNESVSCMPIDTCINREFIECKSKNNTMNKWYYEVDTRVQNEYLGTTDNYKDLQCFGLNSSRLIDIIKKNNEGKLTNEGKTVRGILGISEDIENSELENEILPFSGIKNLRDSFKIEVNGKTIDLLDKGEVSIKCTGFASSAGTIESNRILAQNRAYVLQEYLINQIRFDRNWFSEPEVVNPGVRTRDNSISELNSKAGRHACAEFEIKYKDTEAILDVTQNKLVEQIEGKRSTTAATESNASKNEVSTTKEETVIDIQYDNELEYFEQVNLNEDIVKKSIIDKVKYFDPAFHSITPEGFNSRLTFLHQCTRQGPTIASSDSTNNLTAGNLAFGRPPVCVLRIGDFYNTRIIIDSMTISYDNNGLQWDMNPEGVGLQPMFATVTLSFRFIGGSDLSGPISRLQNAVSYNYYANTSLYDRHSDYRSDYVKPEEWKNQKSTVNEWRIKDKIV